MTVEELKSKSPDFIQRLLGKYTDDQLSPLFRRYVQSAYDKVDASPDDNFDDSIVVPTIVERFLVGLRVHGTDDYVEEAGQGFTAFEALAYALKHIEE